MLEQYAMFRLLKALKKEGSLSELAKRGNIGIGMAKKYLDELLKQDVVKRKIIGRSHIYSYNTNNFFARSNKIYLSLLELNESRVVTELVEKHKGIISMVLYGSVARGDDEDNSDIDVLVITRNKIKISSVKAERMLKRELTTQTYTLQEWRNKAREDKVFYDNVIIDGIVLYGNKPVVI